MTFDLNSIVNQAATESIDLTEAGKGGGGGPTPPAPGTCIATLIGYIELGRRTKKAFQGKGPDKSIRKAKWIFELAGGSNPHTDTEDGGKIAKRITVSTWLPEPGKKPSEKSGFYKLFSALNHAKDPAVKIPAQLLGKHFKVIVSQEKFTPPGGEEITYGSIGSAQEVYRVSPACIDLTDEAGMPTGQVKIIPAPPVLGELRCFLWDYANKAMWDSLFIEGEYEAKVDDKGVVTHPAKSKNVIQNEIKEANDWIGSPMQTILAAGGELDVAELTTAAPDSVASDDPLAGLL